MKDYLRSPGLFRLFLAVPAIILIGRYLLASGGLGNLVESAGEWAVRLLIVTLAVTPIRMLFRGKLWTLWLFKRRRDLGVAAFLYATLHLAAYAARQGSIAVMLADLGHFGILLGWVALICLFIPFALSNDRALRLLGTAWKPLQRTVYVAAVAAFLHWTWLKADNLPAFVHFVPLIFLEAYRLWWNFARPSHQRPRE